MALSSPSALDRLDAPHVTRQATALTVATPLPAAPDTPIHLSQIDGRPAPVLPWKAQAGLSIPDAPVVTDASPVVPVAAPVIDNIAVTDSAATVKTPSAAETAKAKPTPKLVKKKVLPPGNRIVRVGRGDTLSSILVKAGVSHLETDSIISAVRKVYNPRRLRAGQEITLSFAAATQADTDAIFDMVSLSSDIEHEVGAQRNKKGGFSPIDIRRKLKKILVLADGPISVSLSKATSSKGVPREILGEMVNAFSYDIDFQRDIQANDHFEVMYEALADEKGEVLRPKEIVFASLTLSGVHMPIYKYETGNGFADFYNEKGESIRKALLRTPVDGARLSSRYGKRKHPILGYNKMHRGIDFAARKGTPIRAAGNGTVAQAGRNGAYGHYIKIRHNSEFATAYAHMNRYAKGMRSGKRVKQGEIIGYVGTTGRSTGPHLHFEVIRNSKRINPLSVKLPSGSKLSGEELKRFEAVVTDIKQKYVQLEKTTKLASSR
ncbi:MAG: peptidoglycan DD-metalloendopeptidase family protein [Rhodospirillaceae bacterium]|nr:peptidoglycan DD-metalloendopeptidase family protein [Rhodospirillaceae bacterium]MBT5752381.1 peptidoglycan DD-metalloendopeptidase family protein [Rhodospirillaceae bacterium]